jgi:hypothetical protein
MQFQDRNDGKGKSLVSFERKKENTKAKKQESLLPPKSLLSPQLDGGTRYVRGNANVNFSVKNTRQQISKQPGDVVILDCSSLWAH